MPIVNENDTVATEEIRFGDNDRLAALVAALVHADLLVLLSDVDALYTGDPRRPGAAPDRRGRATTRTSPASTIGGAGRAGVGTGGMVTKVEAARIATGFGIPVVLTAAAAGRRRRWPASRSARSSTRSGSRPTARLFWLAHATSPRGRLHLDPGAVARRRSARRKSLLPAGITAVDGTFTAGDPVDLVDAGRRAGGPRAGQLRRGGAARRCSAAPPPNSPRRSARRTNERSSTATTWCCCESQ